jgi:DNA-directed RNA polymerase subunit M
MEFCPNCGKKLLFVKSQDSPISDSVYRCPKCHYIKGFSSEDQASNKNLADRSNQKKEVIVVVDNDQKKLKTMPTISVECTQCHNNLAFFWEVQTRSGDEGSTQFFRCTQCNHTWRLYS